MKQGWAVRVRMLGVFVACLVWCTAGCSDDGGSSSGGSVAAGGSSGGSGAAAADGGAVEDVDDAVPASARACEEACEHYAQSCGAPCGNDCDIERLVYGEACDAQAERFYACAQTAGFNCEEDNVTLATKDCAATLTDYVTCYALDGVRCTPEPGLDSVCENKTGTPFAVRCVSDAVPSDCVPGLSSYYCCPRSG